MWYWFHYHFHFKDEERISYLLKQMFIDVLQEVVDSQYYVYGDT